MIIGDKDRFEVARIKVMIGRLAEAHRWLSEFESLAPLWSFIFNGGSIEETRRTMRIGPTKREGISCEGKIDQQLIDCILDRTTLRKALGDVANHRDVDPIQIAEFIRQSSANYNCNNAALIAGCITLATMLIAQAAAEQLDA